MWFAAADLTTDVEDGKLRLVMANAQETRKFVIAELNTGGLHTATVTTLLTLRPLSDSDMRPLPVTVSGRRAVGEDSKLILEFETVQAGTTVDAANFDLVGRGKLFLERKQVARGYLGQANEEHLLLPAAW